MCIVIAKIAMHLTTKMLTFSVAIKSILRIVKGSKKKELNKHWQSQFKYTLFHNSYLEFAL